MTDINTERAHKEQVKDKLDRFFLTGLTELTGFLLPTYPS
jgi:hypothetical protein